MKTGWLSPTGDFTEAQNCEHIFYARKILHKLDKEMVAGRPDDILLSLGYVHITISLLFMKCFRIPVKASVAYYASKIDFLIQLIIRCIF